MIVDLFQRSVFGLAFEAEDFLGYRSQSEALRALSIDLKRQTVEYELTEKGTPTKRRTEYSPSMAQLIKKLPLTAKEFDLKFEGLRITELGATSTEKEGRVPRHRREDPWDMTSYFDKSEAEKLKKRSNLRLSED